MYAVIEIEATTQPQLCRSGGVTILSLHPTMDKALDAWKAAAFANVDNYSRVHRVLEVPNGND